ncbi:patatin-like phospholipase family protein [Kitasatospora gansuensis]
MVPTGRGSMAPVGELVRGLAGDTMGAALRVAAVDHRTGRRVVFGDPGAPVAAVDRAVMASCAIPGWFAPVEVNGSRYVDGGCWSATNADLMAGRGLDEVYVLAPMALRPSWPDGRGSGRGGAGAPGEPVPAGGDPSVDAGGPAVAGGGGAGAAARADAGGSGGDGAEHDGPGAAGEVLETALHSVARALS